MSYTRQHVGRHGRCSIYFEPATNDLKDPSCPRRQVLGYDATEIVRRLGPLQEQYGAFRRARRDGTSAFRPKPQRTLRSMWIYYVGTDEWQALSPLTKTSYRKGAHSILDFMCENGTLYGDWPIETVSRSTSYKLTKKLVKKISARNADAFDQRSGHTSVKGAVEALRSAWNVVELDQPMLVEGCPRNPFDQIRVSRTGVEVPPATLHHLLDFVVEAKALGYRSLAAAAVFEYECAARTSVAFQNFDCADFRPPENPNAIRILNRKGDFDKWFPLIKADGTPIYELLVAWLTEIKGDRTKGPMFLRDKPSSAGERKPWPTQGNTMTALYDAVQLICQKAGLPPGTAMRSFRKGGIQEGANAGLTISQIQAYTLHADPTVLYRNYIRHSDPLVEDARVKRLAWRSTQNVDIGALGPDHPSEMAAVAPCSPDAEHAVRGSVAPVLAAVRGIFAETDTPIKLRDLLRALQDRGVEVNGSKPEANLATILHKRRNEFPFASGQGYSLASWSRDQLGQ